MTRTRATCTTFAACSMVLKIKAWELPLRKLFEYRWLHRGASRQWDQEVGALPWRKIKFVAIETGASHPITRQGLSAPPEKLHYCEEKKNRKKIFWGTRGLRTLRILWIKNSLPQNEFVVPAPRLYSRKGCNELDANSIECININPSYLPEISRSLLSSAFGFPGTLHLP